MKHRLSLVISGLFIALSAQSETRICPQLFADSKVDTQKTSTVTETSEAERIETEIMNSWRARPEAVEGSIHIVAAKIQEELSLSAAELLNSQESKKLLDISKQVLEGTLGQKSKFHIRGIFNKLKSENQKEKEEFLEINKCLGQLHECVRIVSVQKEKLINIRERFQRLYSSIEDLLTNGTSWSPITLSMFSIFAQSIPSQIEIINSHLNSLNQSEALSIPKLSARRSQLLMKNPELRSLLSTSEFSTEARQLKALLDQLNRKLQKSYDSPQLPIVSEFYNEQIRPILLKNPDLVVDLFLSPFSKRELLFEKTLSDNRISHHLRFSHFEKILPSLPESTKADFVAYWWMNIMAAVNSESPERSASMDPYLDLLKQSFSESNTPEKNDAAILIIVLYELSYDSGSKQLHFQFTEHPGYRSAKYVQNRFDIPVEAIQFPFAARNYLSSAYVPYQQRSLFRLNQLKELLKMISSRELYTTMEQRLAQWRR